MKIYTIATAHLDTSWLWTLEKTIEDYIPLTLEKNFSLFEKYPDYKFNFEGAYRYELIEEYYPELFDKLKKYISLGKWVPCGSSYENGDVNIPSPEALLRNIMFGNRYFMEKFGVTCNDIFLPDCFGFGYALPAVASHAGLKGFSTGKLLWGSAKPVPFDIGKWQGVDGSKLYACLLPFSYTTVLSSIRRNSKYLKKLAENLVSYNLPYTFIYHGTGDRGGSPSEFSVRNMTAELNTNDENNIKVLSASTQEFYDDVSALSEASLPEYNGELLLTEHGAGCYTSRTANKRFNRRNEQLADAAERVACAAMCVNNDEYPQYALDDAWKRLLSHHFHDDITGTSFTECYKRSQNDYIQTLNVFSSEYSAACKSLASTLDTSFCKGIPVIISNPVQSIGDRKEAVTVDTQISDNCYIRVFDADGREIFSQNKRTDDGYISVVFIAEVPSVGIKAYDLRKADSPCTLISSLKVTSNMLENSKYRIFINADGDITSIFDKRLERSVLSAPIRLCMIDDLHSFNYPAWELKYSDISSAVRDTPKKPVITIEEFGPARISLRILRKAGKSTFTQIISLDEDGEICKVFNEVDWRNTGSMLKVEFPLTAENENASYDLGLGVIERANNTDRLFEVPAQNWADVTDRSNEFGVSILSDSKTGWDKPADNLLRMTAIHTPMSNYRWECSQHLLDFGLNRFGFGIYVHKNGYAEGTQLAASNFVQPMQSFITSSHKGTLGTDFSFAQINKNNVLIRAIKKAQDSESIVIRFNEGCGENTENIVFSLSSKIATAFEADGMEQYLGEAEINDGKLVFELKPFEIKTFVVSFVRKDKTASKAEKQLPLQFDSTVITAQNNYQAAALSIPRELIPDSIYSGGVHFDISENNNRNALSCKGQPLVIPRGYNTLYLLATRLGKGKDAKLFVDGDPFTIYVPSAYERTGAWDLIALGQTGYIDKTPLAFTASHSHSVKGDLKAKQFNLFRLKVNVGNHSQIILPDDSKIIIFAAVAVKEKAVFTESSEHYDSLEKREFDYILSESERKHAFPARFENTFDRFIPRKLTKFIDFPSFSTALQPAEVYFAIRTVGDKLKLKRTIKRFK